MVRSMSTLARASSPGSVPEREFEETEHKSAAIRKAIQMAVAGTQSAQSVPENDELVAGRSR